MKKPPTPKLLFALALVILGLSEAGCATRNVNPAQPRANTGYVDFHTESPSDLDWSVACFNDRKQDFQVVFSKLEPPPDGVLRLAFAPGHYRLRVSFFNRVILDPAQVEIEVQEGKITPVEMQLVKADTVSVETREYSYGATAKGRLGRRTKIGSDETTRYRLSAAPELAVPYQLRERMPYAR